MVVESYFFEFKNRVVRLMIGDRIAWSERLRYVSIFRGNGKINICHNDDDKKNVLTVHMENIRDFATYAQGLAAASCLSLEAESKGNQKSYKFVAFRS